MITTTPRERILEELEIAEADLAKVTVQLEEKPELGPGTGSTGAMTWELALARREWIEEQLKSLRSALDRALNGAYGRCQVCGAEIDPERLEILPTTTTCADCARKGRAR